MSPVLFSLVPVFAAIALGNVLRRVRFMEGDAWAAFDRMNYFIFFPALIIHAIGTSDFSGDLVLRLGGTLFTAAMIVAGLLILVRPLVRMPLTPFSSLFQCCIRWNGFVALASGLALFGQEGLSLVAIGMAVMIPTANILSVLVLTHAAGSIKGLRNLGRILITNPLILACVAGLTLNITGIGLPGPTADFALLLGRGALALGLLSVGAGLDLHLARTATGTVLAGTAVKLLVMPTLVLLIAPVYGVTGIALSAAVLIASVPTATSGYILARQLGGDAPLMAALVTATSLAAMVTMPTWLIFFG